MYVVYNKIDEHIKLIIHIKRKVFISNGEIYNLPIGILTGLANASEPTNLMLKYLMISFPYKRKVCLL